MCDITETFFVTSVAGYKATIEHILHFLHTFPTEATVLIKLPSLGNYRAFWMPVDANLYPNDTFVPIVKKYKYVPGCRYIVVSDTIMTRPFDVIVTFNDQVCDNAKNILRLQYSEPPFGIHFIPTFRMVEEEFPFPCDELSQEKLCTLQTTHPEKISSFERAGGVAHNVIGLLRSSKQVRAIRCEHYTTRLVSTHFIVIISSDKFIMDVLYNIFLRKRLAVQKISDDSVSQALCRKLVNGGGFHSISNIVIVKDTFLEMAGLLTNATQVIVADSLVNPIIMKHLCVLSSFSVPVSVHRIDTRRNDGNRVFCETKDVIQMLFPEVTATGDFPDMECIETFPTLPVVIFRGVQYSLCQIFLFELFTGVCLGTHTFTMMYEGKYVDGWLDHNTLSTIMTYVTDVDSSLSGNEQDIFSLWNVLCIGNQNCLSQVDWAALTTLLLCKVIIGTTFDIVFGSVDGDNDTTATFDFIHFCKQLSHGVLWNAQLHFPGGETLLLYDFSNSLSLLRDTNTMTYQLDLMVK